jgi:hypothetical protein
MPFAPANRTTIPPFSREELPNPLVNRKIVPQPDIEKPLVTLTTRMRNGRTIGKDPGESVWSASPVVTFDEW